jgi:hypothetical protein
MLQSSNSVRVARPVEWHREKAGSSMGFLLIAKSRSFALRRRVMGLKPLCRVCWRCKPTFDALISNNPRIIKLLQTED